MAREHQALRAALILLVFVVVALSITSGKYFREADELSRRVAAERTARQVAQEGLEQAVADVQALRHMLTGTGLSESEVQSLREKFGPELQALESRYRRDMESLGPGFEGTKAYMDAHRFLANTLGVNQARLLDEAARSDEAERERERRVAMERQRQDVNTREIARLNEQIAQISQEGPARDQKQFQMLTDMRDELETKNERLRNLQVTSKQTEEKLTRDLTQAKAVIEKQRSEIKRFTKPELETPDGSVAEVSQRLHTVWLTIRGPARPPRGFVFHVFEHDQTSFESAKPKAEVTVVQVTGSGAVEAKITRDSVRNPILVGDLISSPAWPPKDLPKDVE